jgi:hypothetical protein
VVGFYLDADQARHGFLFRNGEFTTIDHPLAADDTQAHDLNDRGQIAGLYERGAGRAAQPRPSPGLGGFLLVERLLDILVSLRPRPPCERIAPGGQLGLRRLVDHRSPRASRR